jgi:hypothetical protein
MQLTQYQSGGQCTWVAGQESHTHTVSVTQYHHVQAMCVTVSDAEQPAVASASCPVLYPLCNFHTVSVEANAHGRWTGQNQYTHHWYQLHSTIMSAVVCDRFLTLSNPVAAALCPLCFTFYNFHSINRVASTWVARLVRITYAHSIS